MIELRLCIASTWLQTFRAHVMT